MSMFNLSEVEEKSAGNGNLYIYPGIREVVINKWIHGKSTNKGTPFIAVELTTVEGKAAGNVDPRSFEFYLTDKTMKMTLSKIKHIVTKITTEEKFASKNPADEEEMVEHLNDLTRGETLRIKFTGEERLNAKGEIKDNATIGLPDFAEAIQEGAKYPVVPASESKLTFDKNNQYDFKKLPKDANTVPEQGMAVNSAGPNW